ncbi:hypothetical protein HU200_002490 [Digitaria exilis]|uniref:Leucine-rich repeat-containing N-terminal plant-type domain-containing protein n=1 Tax=Digitaria exilis TaxID=1010633 RepID=A0A835FZB9_9POAL|nr:hypothetical protein HU200_002490 [Digitaria exilis]
MHPKSAQRLLLIVTVGIVAIICRLSPATAAAASPHHSQQSRQNNVGTSCIPHERDALLTLKQGITKDPYGLLDSWRGGNKDCCHWRGVRCSNRTGHVLKLELRNVHAARDDDYDHVKSTALDRLFHLDLSMNYLNGSSGRIPEFLSSMVSLRYLNLSGIPYSGRVPPHLGNLSKLQNLDLSGVFYERSMYSTDISWLAGLPVLEHLSMSMVNLSTIVAWPDVVNLIPSLKVLDLSYCSLTSASQSLPHINLTNLERLDLSGNSFHHPMASCWFWNLTGLQYLFLEGNNLYGKVPDALGDMTSLQIIDMKFNRNIDAMSTSLKKLCNLTVLDLSWCFLNGSMMELIEQMPQCPSNMLLELHLSRNNITGILPSQMAHLTSLSTLDLSGNLFSGHVPSAIGKLANLTVLDLRFNKLDGVITVKHFAMLAKLKELYLSANSLKIRVSSGWIPPFSLDTADLTYCKIGRLFPVWLQFQVNILWVDISSTGLIDKLPDWFSTTFSKATYMDMSHNQINGRLPENMEFMSLKYFYLSSNELTGQIPSLPRNLSMLDLSLNSLSGNLPSKFGTPQLISINLFSNHITGNISGSICELQNLFWLDLGNNRFDGELPQCFPVKDLSFLMLSNNSFSGDFPSFLQSCKQLHFLDLSINKFYGKLPQWIGGLVGLWFLRLSQNMFSGNIPTTVTNLTHLHHLNLANNRLSGAIPWDLSNLTAMTGKYVKDPYIDSYPYGGYVYIVRTLDFTDRQGI